MWDIYPLLVLLYVEIFQLQFSNAVDKKILSVTVGL